MAQINVAAAGNAEENINLINARFQAEALRRIRGTDCGVLDNSFYSSASVKGLSRTTNASFMWSLTASNVQNITVGRGMATAYGYDIQSEDNVSFTATAPSAGNKYLFIYLEWDLSNPVEAVGSLLIHDNGSSSSWAPLYQDNLITNPIGKYQMPLYRLQINTAGTVTGTQSWGTLGVLTIGNPLRANYAGRAENADLADLATKANTADTKANGTADTSIATTLFVKNAINFGSSTFTLAGVQGNVRRAAKYVIGTMSGSITWNETNINAYWRTDAVWGTLPSGYRPSESYYVTAFMYKGSISGQEQTATHVLRVDTNGNIVVVRPTAAFEVNATVNIMLRFAHVVA